jgi:uncharacterized lipoprotein YddW (UPF0748 family)
VGRAWYQSAIFRSPKAIVIAVLAVAAASALAWPPSAPATASTTVYQGPGTWIDIFDTTLLADPVGTVQQLSLSGVRTIYVETANYTNPRYGSIAYPIGIAALIDAAHASGLKVVAWYLPGFLSRRRDLRRSLDAIRFTTLAGNRFDSFALDIEANRVRRIATRNKRAVRLSKKIRAAVGADYPLAAIVPDQRSTSVWLPSMWPRFPYRRLRPLYDVFLPMSYSSYRGRGATFVYTYTRANVEYLRAATHDPLLPVHVIGGLANKLGSSEDAAVVQAARDEGTLGASFYKLRLSGTGEWQALVDGFTP